MSFNSKYTGQQVEDLLDAVAEGIEEKYPVTKSLRSSISSLVEYTGSPKSGTITHTITRGGGMPYTVQSVSITGNNGATIGTVEQAASGTTDITINEKRTTFSLTAATTPASSGTATLTIDYIRRIRYGYSVKEVLDSPTDVSLNVLSTSVTRTYTATNGSEDAYFWVCVPTYMSISSMKVFNVAIGYSLVTTVDGYKCYRVTTKQAAASTISVDVTGSYNP